MTLLEKFAFMKSMLDEVAPSYHYWTESEKKNRYIVWSEGGEDGNVNGDNSKDAQTIVFDISLYVLDDMDEAIDKMQAVFDKVKIDYVYFGGSFEYETGLYHHNWNVWL